MKKNCRSAALAHRVREYYADMAEGMEPESSSVYVRRMWESGRRPRSFGMVGREKRKETQHGGCRRDGAIHDGKRSL